MKNTAILLLFLLSVLGLILGVYYTADVSIADSQNSDLSSIDVNNDSDLTIASENNQNNVFEKFFT